jgi:membrane peptidoglycan carboxypeptidase
VFKPMAVLLLVPVIVIAAALVAVVLAPPFIGAAVGVRTVDSRLQRLGADFTRIPRFPERSTIYANDGRTVLATVYLDNRKIVKLKQISKNTRRAVLAIEDSGFYEHGALNWTSLVRAVIENAKAGEVVQGGSTLTQQLVGSTLGVGQFDQSFEGKFQELALAMRVEDRYTKDEIFQLYLNQVYMANGVYGFGTAAEFYFGRPASKLSLTEGATLAGMIRAPEYYDPIDRPVKARVRRNDVLNRMMTLGWVPRNKGERAKRQPLGLAEDAGKLKAQRRPFFVDYVADQIVTNDSGEFDVLGRSERARRRALFEGGLSITTTLSPQMQEAAQAAANQPLSVGIYPPGNAPPPDVSIVTVDNRNGAIRTMLSGRNYQRERLDLATTGHQPGSSYKPFILATAFEEGIPPTQQYSSSSPWCSPEWDDEDNCVSNAEGSGVGLVDLYRATTDSINVVFAQLILDVGPEKVAELTEAMQGRPSGSIPGFASQATGSVDMSPLEMATGYQTLANDGRHCPTYAVQSIRRDGKAIYQHTRQDCLQVVDQDVAHQVTAMLETVPTEGTAASAFSGWSPWPVAGKTGTANDNVAVWFVGYTKQLSTAVWVGSPGKPYSMGSVFGGTVAAPIWRTYMARAMAGLPAISFPEPPAPPTGTVPDVVGLNKPGASLKLGEAGFRVAVEVVDSIEERGTVVAQTPAGGTTTYLGTIVTIQVSSGVPATVEVPSVVGKSLSTATSALEQAGFVVKVVEKETGNPDQVGVVLTQSPQAGTPADQGTTVTITVGKKKAGGNGNGGGNGN